LDVIFRGHLGDGDNLTNLDRQVLLSFQGVKGRMLEVCKPIISAVVLTRTPFHVDDLPRFLSLPKRSIKFVLDKLSSVVSVGMMDNRLRVGHLSFTGFLCDLNDVRMISL
jgi:hypothetical protein